MVEYLVLAFLGFFVGGGLLAGFFGGLLGACFFDFFTDSLGVDILVGDFGIAGSFSDIFLFYFDCCKKKTRFPDV